MSAVHETVARLAPAPAASVLPRTCLGDADEILSGSPSAFARAMPDSFRHRINLRKWWEWDYLARCAETCGVLDGRSRGAGLGVGQEALIYFFANRCGHILATDLFSATTAWAEARVATTAAVYDAAPIAFDRSRLTVENADMRAIPVDDGSVDFVWSCSSIEHVPTLKSVLEIFHEIARILKPGGHAFLTTEFCLSPGGYCLPHVNALDENLFETMVARLGALELVGPTDFSFNWANPANGVRARRYPVTGQIGWFADPRFDFLKLGQMVVPAGMSMVCPVGFVLRRRESGRLPDWTDLDLPPHLRDFTDALEVLGQGEPRRAADLLRPYRTGREAGLTPQMRLLIARYYIDALCRDHGAGDNLVRAEIERVLADLPAGPVQDGDCLDLIAYLLDQAGDHGRAAGIWERIALSPSTLHDHAVRAALRRLCSLERLGRAEDGLEFAGAVLADLSVGGWPAGQVETMLCQAAAAIAGEGESPERLIEPVRRRFFDRLRQKVARFDGDLAVPVPLA